MGLYDVPAFINKIIEITDQPKVTYIGYDQGNTQIFYGLTQIQDTFYSRKLNKVIALAPCVYHDVIGSPRTYQSNIGGVRDLGIYGINGPNWANDKRQINDRLPELNK